MVLSSQRLVATYSAQVAETVAINRGLKFAKDPGQSHCVLELDAAVVVNGINDGSLLDSECGGIILDILEHTSCMDGVPVAFVPHLSNQVAHGLAKNTLSCAIDSFWMEEFPVAFTFVQAFSSPSFKLRFLASLASISLALIRKQPSPSILLLQEAAAQVAFVLQSGQHSGVQFTITYGPAASLSSQNQETV